MFEELKPYINDRKRLRDDIDSLKAVAKIIDDYFGLMLVVESDGTIIFFDSDY